MIERHSYLETADQIVVLVGQIVVLADQTAVPVVARLAQSGYFLKLVNIEQDNQNFY